MALDENNTQTSKFDLHVDFSINEEITMQSEPNSRTSSIKYKSRANQIAKMEEDRLRRNSLPLSTEMVLSGSYERNHEVKRQPVRRVRSFRMTPKGIKNDIENEHRLSNVSIHSSVSQKDIFRNRLSSETSNDSAICCGCSSTSSTGYYRVCVMGADSVGKTLLTNQFMSCEYLSSHAFENDDVDEQTLSVVIDNEESTLEFVDYVKHKDEIEKFSFDAFVVVFSVHERPSFNIACTYIRYLRNDLYTDRAIILVANKVDLVRKRQVTPEEAKRIAKENNCKYTETSATFNHKVDELLVGILRQIKVKLNPDISDSNVNGGYKCDGKKSKGPKGLLSKLFRRKSKASVDVLLELD